MQKRVSKGGALEDEETKHISNFSGKCIITVNSRHTQRLLIDEYARTTCCERFRYSLS
jgi:hypothetical protein